jgi:uncharacterized protein with NRDE domain
MCLILVAWHAHAEYPLVVAANRDEFYARPTAAAAQWSDAPGVFGGRDLSAGGTWLAATKAGRFAAVTNVREPGAPAGARSRGQLAQAFLTDNLNPSPQAYIASIDTAEFSGFNLLVADAETLCYYSNRDPDHARGRVLPPGIYGVSNHLLDTPWPKLASAKARFADALERLPDAAEFFALLADDELVADADLPSTGVALEWERTLSAVFVRSPAYGTRASTLLFRDRGGKSRLIERSFDASGGIGEARLAF